MRSRCDPGPRLVALADAQAGAVSREQALAHGLTVESIRRLLAQGRWQRLEAGLYYGESGPPSWPALAWGGVLLGGDHGRLGGEAAAYLNGLTRSPPEIITILIPHGMHRVPRGPWQFVQERVGVRHRSRGAPPHLDVEDSVLDLCEDNDAAQVAALVAQAVQTRRTTIDRLRRRLEARPRHSQRRLLDQLLADVAEGAESPLELRYLRDVERSHGLPRGSRQHRARGTARDVYYSDFATVVELDGRVGHEGSGVFRDMCRDNRSTLFGEATLRYGWADVTERPCSVAAEVAAVLSRRGWTGIPQLCPMCATSRRSE